MFALLVYLSNDAIRIHVLACVFNGAFFEYAKSTKYQNIAGLKKFHRSECGPDSVLSVNYLTEFSTNSLEMQLDPRGISLSISKETFSHLLFSREGPDICFLFGYTHAKIK